MGWGRQSGTTVDMSMMSTGGCASSRPETSPNFRDHALPLSLTRAGWRKCRPDAADNARRHTAAGETVKFRVAPPYKDALGRSRPLDDLLNNRKKIECLSTHRERHDQITDRRNCGRADDGHSHPWPVR